MGTGGGAPGATTLTPDEEKVLSIIVKTASEGISGVIDLLGDKGLSENTEGEEEEEEEPPGSRAATLLVSSKNMLYCSHGVSHAWTSATPLYRLAGGASLDEVPAEFNYTCQFP